MHQEEQVAPSGRLATPMTMNIRIPFLIATRSSKILSTFEILRVDTVCASLWLLQRSPVYLLTFLTGYMGHTSTWSFIRRVISLIEEYSPPNPQTPPEPFNTDGTAFRLTWTPTPLQETPDVSDLPPIDLALYLFHTVKFNLGQFFQLIDEPLFMFRLNELEANPVETAQKHRLWFAEYLIVMAFGKALFSAPSLGSAPAGYEYAARCLAILPDFAQLHDEGLLSVEVLSLVALYFHSIDMRVSAYQYVSTNHFHTTLHDILTFS